MTTRPPGRTDTAVRRGTARRATILAAATTLFARRGYHATSLAEIGALAGIGRPAVLHHFPSKRVLVDAVLDEHARRFAPVATDIAGHGGLEGVRRLVEVARLDERHREHAALWNMLVTESVAPEAELRPRILAAYTGFRHGIATLLRQAERDGDLRPGVDVDAEAVAILAFINGAETSWLLDPTLPLARMIETHLDGVIAGLRAART